MARSARPAKCKTPARRPVETERGFIEGGAAALGAFVLRNPASVGGTTAFVVSLCFVSANALWYQPHAHLGAFFATRSFQSVPVPVAAPEPETTFVIERPQEAAPSDPTVGEVQRILRELNFYDGTVDGISGPATARAVRDYRKRVGLQVSDAIDEPLLEQLGIQPTTAGIAPVPAPRGKPEQASAEPMPQEVAPDRKALVMKVQAGLKAFGNTDMTVDGVMGARTRAAIREFQSLFGLPETGEPDGPLLAKMQEAGLAN